MGGLVPIPKSWSAEKGHSGFDGLPVYDSLQNPARPAAPLIPLPTGWMDLGSNGAPRARIQAPRAIRMHVARDYITRSKRSGALFSKEQIDAGSRFVTHVYAPAHTAFPEEVRIGKRSSAGNGLVRVTAMPLMQPPIPRMNPSPMPATVLVELLSDAVILDELGAPLRGLSPAAMAQALNVAPDAISIERSASICGARIVCGWRRAWGMPSAAVTAVSAGSVVRLEFHDPADAQALRQRAAAGPMFIGEHVHEGFGQVALDPAWMSASVFRVTPIVTSPKTGERHCWPGAEHLVPERLEAVLETADRAAERLRGSIQPSQLGALYERARFAERPAVVTEFLTAMADRPRDRGWKGIARELRPILEHHDDKAETLLFVEALKQIVGGEA